MKGWGLWIVPNVIHSIRGRTNRGKAIGAQTRLEINDLSWQHSNRSFSTPIAGETGNLVTTNDSNRLKPGLYRHFHRKANWECS